MGRALDEVDGDCAIIQPAITLLGSSVSQEDLEELFESVHESIMRQSIIQF